MPSVLVTAAGVTGPDDPRLQPLRDAGWHVRTHRWTGGRPGEEEVVELVQGNDAVIASSAEQYTRSVIERADTLKHIARWGVGYETVDVPAATDNGVLVTTTQGSNHWAVADQAFALMLAVARRVVELDAVARTRKWARPLGRDVWQKTLGVVGLGRIGKGVAQRAFGFEMQVLAYEPFPDHAFCKQWNVELVELDDLFRRSDYVTLHAPGEADNQRLVNSARLALMKPSCRVDQYRARRARGRRRAVRGAARRHHRRAGARRSRGGAAERRPLRSARQRRASRRTSPARPRKRRPSAPKWSSAASCKPRAASRRTVC